MFIQVSFWICSLLVLYTYIGYPVLLFALTSLKRVFVKTEAVFFTEEELPHVSLVVACYNEADILIDKMENTLLLDYPAEKIQICFVTDGSDDHSTDIIGKYKTIKHFHKDERKGKNAAINRILPLISSPYIIFCDANTILNKKAIINLVRHYKDPNVGAVAGEKRVLADDATENAGAGEGAYWKYESQLKKWDSELHSVVGAAGELFSVRKDLMQAVPDGIIIEDFYLSVKVAMEGYQVRYEPEAYAMEAGSASIAEERKRKIRIAAGGLQAVGIFIGLLNFFRHGILSFQYISHRFLRWTLAPLSLLLLLVLNILLVVQEVHFVYSILLIAQTLFYVAALIGNYLELRGRSSKIFLIPFYFAFMNISVYQGFFRLITGSQSAVWEKSNRAKVTEH